MLGHDLRDVVCWTLLEKIEVRRYIKGPFSSGIAPIAPYVTAKFSTIIVHTYLLRSERKSENKLAMPSTKKPRSVWTTTRGTDVCLCFLMFIQKNNNICAGLVCLSTCY